MDAVEGRADPAVAFVPPDVVARRRTRPGASPQALRADVDAPGPLLHQVYVPADALRVLERNLAHPAHEFWPDDLGLLEAVGPLAPRLQGHRQLSDVYLLGLAVKHRGTLASFDGGLAGLATGGRSGSLEVVRTATPPGRR